jgi:hypothetical protein
MISSTQAYRISITLQNMAHRFRVKRQGRAP